MFQNYFKIAFRSLARNKAFSFINVFGLAGGLATCLLIMLYIFDEMSYDKHLEEGERIYRIVSTIDGEEKGWAALAAPFAAGLKEDLPEIEQITRLVKFPGLETMQLTYQDKTEIKQLIETNGYYVDSTFFDLFNYEFTYGDQKTALYQPNTMVISEEIAQKFFGAENPVDKTIQIELPFGKFDYTIKGVFKTEGVKSHIPAHFFLSMRNTDIGDWVAAQTNWATNNIFHTYAKLQEGADAQAFERKLQPFIDRRAGEDMEASGFYRRMFIQPVKHIYLTSNLSYEVASNGNSTFLYILGSIAAFILLIACINFMNLATARSEKRMREVGVRKVVGAQKSSLVQQFLCESFLMSSIALVVGLALAHLLLPFFNALTQKNLHLYDDPKFVASIVGLAIFTGFLSGLYPAFYLSSFRPISVLKGKMLHNFSAAAVRKGLVVFQFTISICLILGAIIIWQQLNFLQTQHLGFNPSQQIVLPLRSEAASNNYNTLKTELLKNPAIKMVTSGSTYPGIPNVSDMLFYAEGKTVNEIVDIQLAAVEDDYIETLGFELLYGRTFSKEFTNDSTSIILNEAALQELGYEPETAVGRIINFDWQGEHHTMRIIGVVKNFNFQSLHNEIKPYGFNSGYFGNPHRYVIATVSTTDYATLLSAVEQSWTTVNPATPFVYSFLDQDFQKNYEKDQRTSLIVAYFTLIAIFIACLGLFGLAAFSAEKRTKEIGVRKVLGASVANVTALLSKDLLKLVLIAIVIASPLAWWAMNKWLQGFAYQITIQWWVFVLAGTLAVGVAFLTVSFQSIKAALANPINSLKNE